MYRDYKDWVDSKRFCYLYKYENNGHDVFYHNFKLKTVLRQDSVKHHGACSTVQTLKGLLVLAVIRVIHIIYIN